MKYALALLACIASWTLADAQEAYYGGRRYTPSNYARAQYCPCSMCDNIRAQWAAASTVSSPEAVAVSEAAAASPYKLETRTRTVTKYRTETVKRCVNGRCFYETRQVPYQVEETYQVRVPIAEVKAKPDATPQPVVDAMLEAMYLGAHDVLWDVGSGRDARYLITAARRYGCRGIGIEIDEEAARASRERIKAAGLSDRIKIITGDALEQDYGAASKVVLYQHEDLQSQILERLPKGTLVGAYAHEPAGIDTKRFRVGISNWAGIACGASDGAFYVGVKK
jgi:hypothetical protein